jgi:apolipoprotein N-acyltransferase
MAYQPDPSARVGKPFANVSRGMTISALWASTREPAGSGRPSPAQCLSTHAHRRCTAFAAAVVSTLLSAGLYAVTFPPVRARWLAWVALVPLLAVIRDASWRRRVGLGFLWTLAVGIGVGIWMPGAVSGYFHQPLTIGVGLFLLVTGLMAAPYYMAFTAAYARLARGGVAGPLLAGAAWAGAELARGRLLNGTLFYFGNSPWATFGYSQATVTSVIQVASVTGVYGISFVLVAVNAAGAEVLRGVVCERRVARPVWAGVGLALGVLGLVLGFGALSVRSAEPYERASPVPIAIVQADLDAATRWDSEGPARTLTAHLQLMRTALDRGHPQIVFWPEAALTFFLEQDTPYRDALVAALHLTGVELVVGALRAGGADGAAPYANTVYLVAPDGRFVARYDKQYLLPFMEYFPFRVELARRRFGRVHEFTPGNPMPPLPTRAGNAGILICNEALLPQIAARRVAEGADYLVNPSNDSWVSDAGFAWQQLDIVSLRAVEQRRYLVRVSDSGPSGVVDPLGRVVASTIAGSPDVLLASVTPLTGRSPYGWMGDLFGGGCLAIVAAALFVRRRRG